VCILGTYAHECRCLNAHACRMVRETESEERVRERDSKSEGESEGDREREREREGGGGKKICSHAHTTVVSRIYCCGV
jgi:hypothetical protein